MRALGVLAQPLGLRLALDQPRPDRSGAGDQLVGVQIALGRRDGRLLHCLLLSAGQRCTLPVVISSDNASRRIDLTRSG